MAHMQGGTPLFRALNPELYMVRVVGLLTQRMTAHMPEAIMFVQRASPAGKLLAFAGSAAMVCPDRCSACSSSELQPYAENPNAGAALHHGFPLPAEARAAAAAAAQAPTASLGSLTQMAASEVTAAVAGPAEHARQASLIRQAKHQVLQHCLA